MSKFLLSLFVIVIMISVPVESNSTAIRVLPTTSINDNIHKPVALKVKDVEKLIGRKLTFKEKVSLFFWRTIKPADSSKSGQTALIFGIIGASLFILGLFVPYVIIGSLAAAIVAVVLGSVAKRQNSSDNKAHAATLLGWITLGAIVLTLLAAVIFWATLF